ncbi:isoprenoid synthase domain-containing protein [Mycena rebaudengoi]|nr:isoprenoid synthase domain-containing protein [Mycena rebaudengoi]
MSTSNEFTVCIQRLFTEIGFRHQPFPPHDTNYWAALHAWMHDTLGPMSSWSLEQLGELEHSSGGIIERAYPYASTELKLPFAKLTAIAILIDDSIEDEFVHAQIVQFSQRLYRGEPQQNGLLALYQESITELSEIFGDDSVLRGLAVVPWINYIDACLMEKQIFTAERELSKTVQIRKFEHAERFAPKFPHYLRSKSGIAEAYAAGIFKARKEQCLPLTRFIKALPDLTMFIEAMNDVLSFHKEEIDGETYNLIHLRTRSLSLSGVRGLGANEEWTCYDTLRLLCDEIREATLRIDRVLRLEECERKLQGKSDVHDIDELDVEISNQWRGWRDGYISWHLECRRYKLGFLGNVVTGVNRKL